MFFRKGGKVRSCGKTCGHPACAICHVPPLQVLLLMVVDVARTDVLYWKHCVDHCRRYRCCRSSTVIIIVFLVHVIVVVAAAALNLHRMLDIQGLSQTFLSVA